MTKTSPLIVFLLRISLMFVIQFIIILISEYFIPGAFEFLVGILPVLTLLSAVVNTILKQFMLWFFNDKSRTFALVIKFITTILVIGLACVVAVWFNIPWAGMLSIFMTILTLPILLIEIIGHWYAMKQ